MRRQQQRQLQRAERTSAGQAEEGEGGVTQTPWKKAAIEFANEIEMMMCTLSVSLQSQEHSHCSARVHGGTGRGSALQGFCRSC
jgi:hypothetical protein